MVVSRVIIAAGVACGLGASCSLTFAQSLTVPAGIPSDTAPGGRAGIPEGGREDGLSPSVAPDAKLATGSVPFSRWSGIHRPSSIEPND